MILGKAISPFALRKKINGVVPTDPDAQLFITATGISGTNATATNKLVIDLKAANIWTKMKGIYPIVGGSASTHAVNLKTPGTYNLSFQTGWTHSSTGMTPNGTTYASSQIIPSAVLSQNSTHVSYYSRTNNNSLYDFGHDWTSQTSLIYLLSRYSDSKSTFRLNSQNTAGTESSQTIADSLGLFAINRTSSTVQSLIKNSTKYNFNLNSFGLPTASIILGGIYSGAFYGSTRQCAFASIGDGLTDAELLAYYNAVQLFQTTLSRQV